METSQVLDTPELEKPVVVYAGKDARFANYIIDIIIRYLFVYLVSIGSGILPESVQGIITFIGLLVFIAYYIIFEYVFGKTPGKFITRTHVVTYDGEHPTFLNIVGRSLCRIIPFDNVSFLFSFLGWHDSISKTCVVKDNPNP